MSHGSILLVPDEQLHIFGGIFFKMHFNIVLTYTGQVQRSQYGNSVQAGRSGDRMLVGQKFPQPPRPYLGPTHPPAKWEQGQFPENKAAGQWI